MEETTLIWSAYLGYGEVVRVLLGHKADLGVKNVRGETALQRASKLLQQAGAIE